MLWRSKFFSMLQLKRILQLQYDRCKSPTGALYTVVCLSIRKFVKFSLSSSPVLHQALRITILVSFSPFPTHNIAKLFGSSEK